MGTYSSLRITYDAHNTSIIQWDLDKSNKFLWSRESKSHLTRTSDKSKYSEFERIFSVPSDSTYQGPTVHICFV